MKISWGYMIIFYLIDMCIGPSPLSSPLSSSILLLLKAHEDVILLMDQLITRHK